MRCAMLKTCYTFLLIVFAGLQLHGQEQDATAAGKELASKSIKLFPNPATSVLNVIGLSNTEHAHIMVTDGYGNLVLEHQWGIRNNALSLPVAHLQEGVHMITIRSEKETAQLKFHKQ